MMDILQLSRRIMRYAAITGFVLIAMAVAWTLGPGASWVLRHVDGVHVGGRDGLNGKDLADALNAVRGRALAIATGLAALLAVYYTARNADTARRTLQQSEKVAQRTAELAEQGQVTDRYTKAIEQLGSRYLEIRIGGIYALERIAIDSARDHPTVMEVLAAFVREHATADSPAAALHAAAETPLGAALPRPPDADIQAAVTVIGRRFTARDIREINLAGVQLTYADLAFLNLRNARLIGANLSAAKINQADLTNTKLADSNLTDAELTRAHLSCARLDNADMSGANMTGAFLNKAFLPQAKLLQANLVIAEFIDANLDGANLSRATLTRTCLRKANLTGADLTGADLTGADLTGADLTGANLADANLTDANLDGAIQTSDTKWPAGYSPPGPNIL
ncbi:pentapeptide repeat-containing protein [Actinoallomurus bryophytorum]|uniref:Uncharacterized protein YjbI with pentapeptide repeats n=1 Tax=Actinoallomurus bryophytorum TaxID=1490222 RepID=A0A543CG32_9ACTN|nr:pentapeptide repeat-containing protein [Actinoallomurus bryophytorum]TQL96028.1 uncharacterized protein YjbI with pentapeptide repeats [Actinoallomurus bryophytorum]